MFIVSLTYVKPLELVDEFISEHVAFLDAQYAAGHFQLSGRKVPRAGGVILATVENRETLDEILLQDPFCREQLAEYEVIEIVPTKSSERLKHLLDC